MSHSASFIQLKKYLDARCTELNLFPIPDSTIKILDDNEIDSSILLFLDVASLKETNIPVGSIAKLLRIIADEKVKSNTAAHSQNVIFPSTQPNSGNNSNDNNNNSNSNDDESCSTSVARNVTRTMMMSIDEDENLARQLDAEYQELEPGPLLELLEQAQSASVLKVAVENLHRTACGASGGASKIDCQRLLDAVSKQIAFLDEDETISDLIGTSLVNIRARTPAEKQSFALDEPLLNLAYGQVMNAKRDETKLQWLAAVANAWASFLRKHPLGSVAEDPYYKNFGRNFASIVLELMKKKSFDISARRETGEDESLQRLILLWHYIAQSDARACVKAQRQGDLVKPLFDFASLQLLLDNGVERASTQETLKILLGTAHNLVVVLLPTNTINVRAIANSIHRCLEQCTSPECVQNLIDMLHMLFRRQELREQMDEHLRCDDVVKKLKKSSDNVKSKEMIEHFDAIHQKKLKESIKRRLDTIKASASSDLMDVLVNARFNGEILGLLSKTDIPTQFPTLDFTQKKELESYIDRLAAYPSSAISALLSNRGIPNRLILPPTDVVITMQQIGKGSSGQLFRASITATGEVCAAKVFSDLDVGLLEALNYSRLFRFDVVTRLLGVTAIPADGEVPERIVLLLELAERNLSRLLELRTSSLPVSTILRYAIQIAKGLAYLHEADATTGKLRIFHLDIKPNNILVFPNGNFKLVGFGSIVTSDHTVTQKSTLSVSELYLPPEYLEAKRRRVRFPVAATFDIFSFGIVLLEIMSKPGQIDAIREKIRNRQHEAIDEPCFLDFTRLVDLLAPEVFASPEGMKLVEICKKCVMVDPKQRPQNGMELVAELVPYESDDANTTDSLDSQVGTHIAKREATAALAEGTNTRLGLAGEDGDSFLQGAQFGGGRPNVDSNSLVALDLERQ